MLNGAQRTSSKKKTANASTFYRSDLSFIIWNGLLIGTIGVLFWDYI
jgi:hypothetical protein